jgi:hypothetical protein
MKEEEKEIRKRMRAAAVQDHDQSLFDLLGTYYTRDICFLINEIDLLREAAYGKDKK